MRGRESNQATEEIDLGYPSENPDLSSNPLTDADIFEIKERVNNEYADADLDDIEARNDMLEEECYEISIELERDGESASPDRLYEFATLSAEREAIKHLLETHSRE
jgi:hypothetical protein